MIYYFKNAIVFFCAVILPRTIYGFITSSLSFRRKLMNFSLEDLFTDDLASRQETEAALLKMPPKRSIPALIESSKYSDEYYEAAMRILTKIGRKAVKHLLAEIVKCSNVAKPDPNRISLCINALNDIEPEAITRIDVNPVVQILSSELMNYDSVYVYLHRYSDKVTYQALQILRQQAIDIILSSLKEADNFTTMLYLLTTLDSEILKKKDFSEYIPRLVDALTYDDSTSIEAMFVLIKFGTKAVLELINACNSSDTQVRASSIFILGEIGNSYANKVLLDGLENDDEYVDSSNPESFFYVHPEDIQNGVYPEWTSSLRYYYANALCKINHNAVIDQAEQLLMSEDNSKKIITDVIPNVVSDISLIEDEYGVEVGIMSP